MGFREDTERPNTPSSGDGAEGSEAAMVRGPAATEKPDGPAKRNLWDAPEIAWPVAILSGFGGTWLGLELRLPGLPAVLAVACFLPIYARFLGRGRIYFALLLCVAWALGIAAAVIGLGLELDPAISQAGYWRPRLIGAGGFFQSDLPAPIGSGDAASSVGFTSTLVRDAVGVAFAALFARPLLGALSLLAVAIAQAAIAAGVLQIALVARAKGEEPLMMAALGWPPHLGLTVAGALVLIVSIAAPGPLFPLRYAVETRRRLLWVGLGLALVGLLARVLRADDWAAAMGRWLT